MVALDAVEGLGVTTVEALKRKIIDGREIETLVRIEVDGLRQHTDFHRLEVLGTFRDDDNVCPVLSFQGFPQPTRRNQFVIDDEPMIVDEQDVDARFHIAMLEGVVEEDDVDILGLFVMGEAVDAVGALLVHGDIDVRKLLLHLEGLVANPRHGRGGIGEDIAFRLALIAS